MQKCSKCRKLKSKRRFRKDLRYTTGHETVCKDCKKQYMKIWRALSYKKIARSGKLWRKKNRDKVLAAKKRYRQRHPERARQQVRNAHHRRGKIYRARRYFILIAERYGITKEQIQKQSKKQKHRCAVCCKKQKCGKRRRLYVDHDHKTGEFRGLTCFSCNSMLGFAKDNIKTLQAAIRYLRRSK